MLTPISPAGAPLFGTFDFLTTTKPVALVDGVNNFYAGDSVLLPTDETEEGGVLVWQRATVTGLSPGDILFQYDPNSEFTETWESYDASIADGAVLTISASFLGDDPIATVVTSGLPFANALGQSVLGSMQSALGDLNGRLFNLRAGWGEEGGGSLTASLDDGVIVGQGDGDPDKNPMANKVLRSRQWEVFTTVNYANISLGAIGNQAGVDAQTWAPSVGIERHVSRSLAIGFVASLLETRQDYTNGLGSLDMEGIALSAYASYVRRAFWGDVLYSFGRHELDSQRNPGASFPVANGDTTAFTNAVQLNGGWNFRFQNNTLVTGPFVGVDWLHVNVDDYSETGGGLAALAYEERSVDSLVSRVGWSVSKEFDTDFAKITPQVRLSYERQNLSNNDGTSVNLINQSFSATANSQAPGQDYMVAGAGVNFAFNQQFSLLLTYQGQFLRQDMQAHYAGLRFGYQF